MKRDLRHSLKRIADALGAGSVIDPATHIEQLSYLIYLKLLDEE